MCYSLLMLQSYFLAILSGLLMGLAWNVPGTVLSALLGWAGTFLVVFLVRSGSRQYSLMYVSGVTANVLGFHWLVMTIADFGGFPVAAAALVFTLFVLISSIQYLIFVFIYRNLGQFLEKWALKAAVAFTLSELISLRIFPWHFGHTQIAFIPLAQIADIAGVLLITFLMFLCAEALIKAFLEKETKAPFALASVIFVAGLAYGFERAATFSHLEGPKQEVALIQANISIEEKHNMKFFMDNKERYVELSKKIARPNLLIIWPETVVMDWIDAKITSSLDDYRLPTLDDVSMLIGSLTYSSREELHNSAVAIYNDQTIPAPYHKKILMPFGEYMPFEKTFPWLRELNPAMGNFTPGSGVTVFDFPMKHLGRNLKVSPLICYEDVIPGLAREASRQGAELLVNLTNDAWFGDTVAPHQHHLIASFRAIENRRFLLRSTNSGLTAVVNPIGQTVSQIPPFEEGIIEEKIIPLNEKTLYTEYIGQKPWWLLLIITACLIIYRKSKLRKGIGL